MNADTNIDLDVLQQTIQDRIATQFPDLVTVEFYRSERNTIPVPACLLELADLEPAPDIDPGTEQLAVNAMFEARLVLGFRTANVKKEIRKLAAALGSFLHEQRFGMPIGPGQVQQIAPDEFSPELDQYEVWSVVWTHPVHLGETVWTNDGTIPTQVLASWEPRVGVPHEVDYVEVPGTEGME